MTKNELHRKYCSNCMLFEIGTCRGIMYHVPKLSEQPLCRTVKNKLKELEKQE